MKDRFTHALLIACVLLGGVAVGIALGAPDAFATNDAGPDEVAAYDAGAPSATPAAEAPAKPAPPAVAAPAAGGEPTPTAVADAFKGGEYMLAIAGLVWLLVGLIRRFTPVDDWTGWKKKILAFAIAGVLAGSLAVWQGGGIGIGVLVLALGAGWQAAGINDHIKDAAGAAGK